MQKNNKLVNNDKCSDIINKPVRNHNDAASA